MELSGQIFSAAFAKQNASMHKPQHTNTCSQAHTITRQRSHTTCILLYPTTLFSQKLQKYILHYITCIQIYFWTMLPLCSLSLMLSSALMCWGLMCVLVIQVNTFACGAYFHSGSHCTHILFRTAVPLLFTHADVSGITTATVLGINLFRVMCHTVVTIVGVLLKELAPQLCIPLVPQ